MLRYPTTPRKLKNMQSKTSGEEIIEDDNGEVIGVKGNVARLAQALKGHGASFGKSILVSGSDTFRRSSSTNSSGYNNNYGAMQRRSSLRSSHQISERATTNSYERMSSLGSSDGDCKCRCERTNYSLRHRSGNNDTGRRYTDDAWEPRPVGRISRYQDACEPGSSRRYNNVSKDRFTDGDSNYDFRNVASTESQNFTEGQASVNDLRNIFNADRINTATYKDYKTQSWNPSVRQLRSGEEVTIYRDRQGVGETKHRWLRDDKRATVINAEMHYSEKCDAFIKSSWEDYDYECTDRSVQEVEDDEEEVVVSDSWEVVHSVPFEYNLVNEDTDVANECGAYSEIEEQSHTTTRGNPRYSFMNDTPRREGTSGNQSSDCDKYKRNVANENIIYKRYLESLNAKVTT